MSYLAVSSSSVLMPQLWYGSTQIGFDLQWDYAIVNDHRPSVLYLTSAKTKFFYDFVFNSYNFLDIDKLEVSPK